MTVLERDGVRLPVWRRRGDGSLGSQRWVLLLHGACADHRTFDALEFPGYDVLVPDLRGQGAAGGVGDFEAILGDLQVVLEEFGVTKVDVVGHSFGAHLAQELLVRTPGRVRSLTLIGCHDQHRARDLSERLRVAVTSAVVRVVPWRSFARFSARVSSPVPAVREYLLETHLAAGAETFLGLGRSGSSAKRPVARYDVPVLLVRGEREGFLAGISAEIARRAAVARTVVVPGTGHLCHQEDPTTVGAAVREFLAAPR